MLYAFPTTDLLASVLLHCFLFYCGLHLLVFLKGCMVYSESSLIWLHWVFRKNTPHWRIKKIKAAHQRSRGFCPLTPTEVALFLKALGYPASTHIYIAAGEIYGGQERMAGFLSRFPNVMSKVNLIYFANAFFTI